LARRPSILPPWPSSSLAQASQRSRALSPLIHAPRRGPAQSAEATGHRALLLLSVSLPRQARM
jgi:hypothetical protein